METILLDNSGVTPFKKLCEGRQKHGMTACSDPLMHLCLWRRA